MYIHGRSPFKVRFIIIYIVPHHKRNCKRKVLEHDIQALFSLTFFNQSAYFAPFFLGNYSIRPEVIIVIMKPSLTYKGLRGSSVDNLQRRPSFIATFPLHKEFILFKNVCPCAGTRGIKRGPLCFCLLLLYPISICFASLASLTHSGSGG